MKKLAVLMLTLVIAFGFGTAASAAMSIEIDFYGGTTSLLQGDYDTGGTINLVPTVDWVMVDIVALDVPLDNGVSSFSWLLNFDATNMQVSGLGNSGWPGFIADQEVDNTAGTVALEGLSVFPPDGDVVLGTFRIDCTGLSIDELFIAQWHDSNNLLADGADYSGLYPQGVFATVNQVPIPGAVWLLGSGLFGLVAIRRKKKS
jgi:hypothetical protein